MRRFSLILAFLSGGLASVMPLILNNRVIELARFPDRVLYLPALLLGVVSWLRIRTMARTWPVLACLAVLFLGVVAVDSTERGRGLLIFAGLAAAIPISALIVEQKAVLVCIKAFVFASALNMALLIFASDGILSSQRFGNLVVDDMRISNPNAVAAQLGFAAVLTLVLMQHEGSSRHSSGIGRKKFSKREAKLLLLVGYFAIGILLTASRGAIVTMSLIAVLMIASSATKLTYRMLGCVGLTLGTLLLVTTDNAVVSRFEDTSGVVALGDRLPIWKEAIHVSQSSFKNRWFGVGTGGTEKALAESTVVDLSAHQGEDGVMRKATHNSYVEWLLSHGFCGVVVGAILLFATLRRAWRFDLIDGTNDRRLLFAFCLIISMVTALYRSTFTTPMCALMLAMLSGPYVVSRPVPKDTQRSESARTPRKTLSGSNKQLSRNGIGHLRGWSRV